KVAFSGGVWMPNVTPAAAGEAAMSTAPRTIVARIIAGPSLVTRGRIKMAGSGTRCQRQPTAARTAGGTVALALALGFNAVIAGAGLFYAIGVLGLVRFCRGADTQPHVQPMAAAAD